MKKLSDFCGEEAVDLWADLLDPLSEICTNEKVQKAVKDGRPYIEIVKTILHECRAEAVAILTAIDPEPLNGLNIVVRLVNVITEIGKNEDVRSFFGFAAREKKAEESSGLLTENTEGGEN